MKREKPQNPQEYMIYCQNLDGKQGNSSCLTMVNAHSCQNFSFISICSHQQGESTIIIIIIIPSALPSVFISQQQHSLSSSCLSSFYSKPKLSYLSILLNSNDYLSFHLKPESKWIWFSRISEQGIQEREREKKKW